MQCPRTGPFHIPSGSPPSDVGSTIQQPTAQAQRATDFPLATAADAANMVYSDDSLGEENERYVPVSFQYLPILAYFAQTAAELWLRRKQRCDKGLAGLLELVPDISKALHCSENGESAEWQASS